ncbi:MAG TPA: YggT family protein [Burkholderiales bacterium]|nr:YggT family protein [Burkholderiales bacterium]
MPTQVLQFLLETFLGLFALALLLRFFMQWLRAPVRNPLSHFLAALTNWIVVPARSVIPGLWGLDLATLVLAWLTEFVLVLATYWLKGPGLGPAVGASLVLIAFLALVQLVKLSIWILMISVVVQAVLTWVSPFSPAMPLLNSLVRPFLRVFQRRIPPVGNVDLSPLFVLVVCQLLLMVVSWLEAAVVRTMV